MKKMKMHSPDLTDANIARIRDLFPGCVTEMRDEHGALRPAVDFDQLRQELSGHIVDGPQERYHLNWPGKRTALLAANAPIAKTLRPCHEQSVTFDKTRNLFIEGDNLDALKLLQETYLGKVKMIYIDPPYNTGNDFIFKDDFTETAQEYFYRSSQRDGNGDRLAANTDSNGRFHSDWLSFIYPRLKLARNLLKEDGVIFVSIDDNEVHNLRSVMNEVFGQGNFISVMVWKKRTGSNDAQNNASIDHDYVVCYGKSESMLNGVEKDFSNYTNPDNDPKGLWARDNLTCNKTASERPNLFYPITDPATGIEYQCSPNRVWVYEKTRMDNIIAEGKVLFPKTAAGTPMYKRYLYEVRSKRKPFSSMIDTEMNFLATKKLRKLIGGQYFDHPKGVDLLKQLINQGANSNDLILDFFAGSGTTAHAVMQLNAEDGGNRCYIAVQLPEATGEKSEAHKAGYKTIADIAKERIRRAGQQILTGDCHAGWSRDIGFRVLKIDTTCMANVYYAPGDTKQGALLAAVDNIKPGRDAPEDLLFQVLADQGIDLTLPIEKREIQGKAVFFVNEEPYDLIACFDAGITEELVKALAAYRPGRVVFRDTGFASDAVKINAEQIFRQLSPATDVVAI